MFFPRRYQHLRRYRQVAEVLLRHGFGFAVEELGFRRFLPLRRRLRQAPGPAVPVPRGARLVAALEELGPTFVKLGQLLSTRPDLFPPDVLNALEELQDRVPPVPAEKARGVIEAELNLPLEQAFPEFDPEPIAAASLGQVHRARTARGEPVVVKVLRPEIDRVVLMDLEILGDVARLVEERFHPAAVRPTELAEEIARHLRRELDYRIEARNIERIAQNFRDDPMIRIPRVYWEYTTRRVLTMEFVEGIKVSHVQLLDAAGIDRRAVAVRGARAFLKQVLVDGVFHGDPHPGNIFVQADGGIALIDFGVVGRLDDDTLAHLANLFLAVIRRRIPQVIREMQALGALEGDVDRRALRRELEEIVDRHWGRPLREIELGAVVHEALEITRRHRIRLPSDLSLLAKALLTMEGVGKLLDPEFNALEVAEPFAVHLMRRRLAPRRALRTVAHALAEEVEILAGLPRKLDTALDQLTRGDVQIRFRHQGLEPLLHHIDTAANRIALAFLVFALTAGGSILTAAGTAPQVWGVSVPGLASLLLAGGLGLLLFLAVLRSGRL